MAHGRQTLLICLVMPFQEGELARLFSNCRSLSLCLTKDTSGALQARLGQLSALMGLRTLDIQGEWGLYGYPTPGECNWHLGYDALDLVRRLKLNEVTLQHTGYGNKRGRQSCVHVPVTRVGTLQLACRLPPPCGPSNYT